MLHPEGIVQMHVFNVRKIGGELFCNLNFLVLLVVIEDYVARVVGI